MDDPTNYFGMFPIKLYEESRNAKLCVTLSYLVSLSRKEGYCFATNKYLAELLGKSVRTVISELRKLENLGYIRCEYINNDRHTQRRIYISFDGNIDCVLASKKRVVKTQLGGCESLQGGGARTYNHINLKDNNRR